MESESILSREPPDADRRVAYGSDPEQFIDVYLPHDKGPHPVVFFIHGGYWRVKYGLSTAAHLCAALAKMGIATWNIEYRRVGVRGGWPETFEDVRAAYQFLLRHGAEEQKLDLKRLCVAGHSAGGQLAMCLAAHEKSVTHVFSLAGVLDLRRGWELHLSNDAVAGFLGGPPADVPEHYREASPMEQPIPHAVQKLVHGRKDQSVPYELSERYAQAKRKSGENVELITLADADHFQIVDPTSAVWSRVEAVFRELVHKP